MPDKYYINGFIQGNKHILLSLMVKILLFMRFRENRQSEKLVIQYNRLDYLSID